jgi:ABC-type antimicrobial peptide transport system permease subunit
MEIGHGSRSSIERSIASMGAETITIQPGTAASGGVTFGGGSAMTLTPEDALAIERECPSVRVTAPVVRSRMQVIYGNRNWVPLFIYGSTPAYLDVRNWPMAEGEMFTEQDVRNASKVCVLGLTLVRELFLGQSPIGQEVRIQNVSVKVIGVLGPKGSNMMGMDDDDFVLAPWTTIKQRISASSVTEQNQSSRATLTEQQVNTLSNLYPGDVSLYPERSVSQAAAHPMPVRFTNVDRIMAAAQSPGHVDSAVREITDLLRERHRIRPGEADDFNVRDMTEMIANLSATTGVMTRLLLAVALISLVVGGVGIMNIMLVSVTERTREIGLRMAVGARGRDILRQFLVESVLLCVMGGALGILIGRGSSLLVRQFLEWPTELSVGAILAAVVVSVSVGVIFGYYPAWKASRLDPIEALRYE